LGTHEPPSIGDDRPVQCVLREMRDDDLDVLFEQWADPAAAHMAELVLRLDQA
jgi:hypothetical protein